MGFVEQIEQNADSMGMSDVMLIRALKRAERFCVNMFPHAAFTGIRLAGAYEEGPVFLVFRQYNGQPGLFTETHPRDGGDMVTVELEYSNRRNRELAAQVMPRLIAALLEGSRERADAAIQSVANLNRFLDEIGAS